MQYEAKSPKEYFELLENDWRKDKLLQIREFILKHGPELEEGILYKMLAYGDEETQVLGLNTQKSYVSLYVSSIQKNENANTLLEGFDYGKGCIRIKKTIATNKTELETFIKQMIEKWRAGKMFHASKFNSTTQSKKYVTPYC